MRYRRMRCVRFGEEIPFMECDDAREYRKVRESFYPRLLQLEAAGKRDAMTARPMILLNPGPGEHDREREAGDDAPRHLPARAGVRRVLASVRDAVTRVVHAGTTYTSVLLGGSGTAGVEAAISSSVPARKAACW